MALQSKHEKHDSAIFAWARKMKAEVLRWKKPDRVIKKPASKTPKILIVSSDTGGGHRSAATAIVAGVNKFWHSDSYAVRVLRVIEESCTISKKLVGLYNFILKYRQPWMKYLYKAVNHLQLEQRGYFYRRAVTYLLDKFDEWVPTIIVSVHPLTQHALARFLKEFGLADKIPLVTVVTDPFNEFWKSWACDDVQHYLVASEEALEQLVAFGVKRERIKIVGMPVHPKFEPPDEQAVENARRALDLDPQKFTVLFNAGWIGGGNILEIFREFVRGELNVQAIFLAGKDEKWFAEAQALAEETNIKIKVILYTEQMEKLMHAASVMVSKLGGLTTFEALTCRVPIIGDATTEPMPQESGTAIALEKRGAGVLLRRASDIVPEVRRMIEDAAYYSSLQTATAVMALPGGTQRIVEEIKSLSLRS